MPLTCIVVNCGSRANRDRVSFYSVPTALNHKFEVHLNELSKQRRQKWLAAINRGDLTETKIKTQRVCSKHFITGKPSALRDTNDPDWVPSQNLGYISGPSINKHALDSNERANKRQKLEINEPPPFLEV